jgi:hypothetical protein
MRKAATIDIVVGNEAAHTPYTTYPTNNTQRICSIYEYLSVSFFFYIEIVIKETNKKTI